MLKKSIVGLIAVLTLAMGSQAMATDGKAELVNSNVTPFKTIGIGGGDWNYGSSIIGAQKKCWSYYKHPEEFHSATAIIGDDKKRNMRKLANGQMQKHMQTRNIPVMHTGIMRQNDLNNITITSNYHTLLRRVTYGMFLRKV
ncbi:hypothetical protein EX87_20425 (plasmid) [Brevibacillus laterosporus]|uniref:Bacteriocin n=2 Tax=Brevibacillus laterosporus TaxID=1465 RepID=A0A0F7EJ60_BRELA|nr:hypothetical protein EX87_20425 [Brevibacillus laterosporus]